MGFGLGNIDMKKQNIATPLIVLKLFSTICANNKLRE